MDRERLFQVVAESLKPGGWFGIQEHFISPARVDRVHRRLLQDTPRHPHRVPRRRRGGRFRAGAGRGRHRPRRRVLGAVHGLEHRRAGPRGGPRRPVPLVARAAPGVRHHARQAVPHLARPRAGDPAAAVPSRRGQLTDGTRVRRQHPPLPDRLATAAVLLAVREGSDPPQGGRARRALHRLDRCLRSVPRRHRARLGTGLAQRRPRQPDRPPRRRGDHAGLRPVVLLGLRRGRLAGLRQPARHPPRPSSPTGPGCSASSRRPAPACCRPGRTAPRWRTSRPAPGPYSSVPAAPLHGGHAGVAARRRLAGRPRRAGHHAGPERLRGDAELDRRHAVPADLVRGGGRYRRRRPTCCTRRPSRP